MRRSRLLFMALTAALSLLVAALSAAQGLQANRCFSGTCEPNGTLYLAGFHVAKGDQTITFTSTAPSGGTVGGPTYTVTATASSGLSVMFTIDGSAASMCSISGSTVAFTGVGICVIDANQAGDANYNAAPQAQQAFGVGDGG